MSTRERRRLKLIRLAAELFLTNGREGVSMQSIAEAADISRASLYTYFGSKDEIFDAAVDGITFSVRDRAKNALREMSEGASLQEKLFSMFEAQQKAWFEVSERQRSIFYFEIWRRSQSLARERGEMMPFHELVLDTLEKERTLNYSSPDHDLPDLNILSNTIYLGASAILYADAGASEKKKLLGTFVNVFAMGLAK